MNLLPSSRTLLLFLMVASLCPTIGHAQDQLATFPDDWYGDWEGQVTTYAMGGRKLYDLKMELHVSPTDSAHRIKWTIVYDTGEKRDERGYEMVAQDTAYTYFILDEKNSIFLDSYRSRNYLLSRFSVNQTLLMTSYYHAGDHIRCEIFTGRMDEKNVSGDTLDPSIGVTEVASYPMSSVQRALLYRK
ncbi:MAG: hypothetical protein AAGI38_18780 [Bacteroidota bacterium]